MDAITLKVIAYTDAAAAIQDIRRQVFQIEQGVDFALDFDGQDDDATHIIAYSNEHPIGTARIRYLSDQTAKIERVAVLSSYRGQKIGKQIMETAIAYLNTKSIPVIKINAQVHARAFYEKLGFEQRGEEFDEAGIPHIEMRIESSTQ